MENTKPVDPILFFREVTLRLCGHLEIEEGLRQCVRYLQDFMPADALYLWRYEIALSAMRIVARATAERADRMDVLVSLPEDACRALEQRRQTCLAGKLPKVIVHNRPAQEPSTCALEAEMGEPLSSAMSLPLVVEEQPLGSLALLAEGVDRFTEEHAELYAQLGEPFYVALSNTLRYDEVVRLKDRFADDNRQLHQDLQRMVGDEIIGADFGLRDTMQQVHKVAATDTPVLLLGETGVGKDVIANAIHRGSPRRDGPFIPVNCGAIPASLIDSELFGHEKGAFTGALARKRGRFERADKGTIFLDEIGEMPLEAQVRLLRVLQQREIERVGGTSSIRVDIRIIAATNKDLKQMIADGRFREDLWYRLNVFPIVLPPLRERTVDIAALVQHFLERKARDLKLGPTPKLAPGAMDALVAYAWPGNVRELENVVERAMILHRDEPLRFDGLEPTSVAHPDRRADDDRVVELDSVISDHIRWVLKKTGGKIHGPGGAGELLDMNPSTLRARMRKLGIVVEKP
jgi:formate hydrogenlyase transcriptional activator